MDNISEKYMFEALVKIQIILYLGQKKLLKGYNSLKLCPFLKVSNCITKGYEYIKSTYLIINVIMTYCFYK